MARKPSAATNLRVGERYSDDTIPSISDFERTVRSTLAGLVAALIEFDGKVEPDFGGLRLSTVIIAIMTVYRLALKSIVEASICQGAWIWVSAFRQHRRKKTTPANLGDFKLFNEAAGGLWGSLVLLWRMRGTHLACVGALIIVLIHGFETFSQQMVTFDERPAPVANYSYAPTQPRSETWRNYSPKGSGGDMTLGLSTKAAIYNGILSSRVPDLPITCLTANCTWPIFPSLAICGDCDPVGYTKICSSSDGCRYTTSAGTSISTSASDDPEYRLTVAPTDSSQDAIRNGTQAYFSSFEVLAIAKTPIRSTIQSYQCAMWFCLNSYNVTVVNGLPSTVVVSNWSKTEFSAETSAHFDEYVFMDVPSEMNASPDAEFSIPAEALHILQAFVSSLMLGNASTVGGTSDYSSDWIQAVQMAASDLPSWMSNLALSITNDVRVSGIVDRGRAATYAGSAFRPTPYVQVQWGWVVYPLTLMVIAFAYLGQTVWRTARDQVPAWKCDSLPMLFARIDDNIHRIVGNGMDVPEGLNDRVGKTNVELVRKGNGQWLFRMPLAGKNPKDSV